MHVHTWIFFGRCNSYPGCNLLHQTNLRYSMKDKCIDWIHWMTNHGQIINIFGQNTFKQTVLSYLLIWLYKQCYDRLRQSCDTRHTDWCTSLERNILSYVSLMKSRDFLHMQTFKNIWMSRECKKICLC